MESKNIKEKPKSWTLTVILWFFIKIDRENIKYKEKNIK